MFEKVHGFKVSEVVFMDNNGKVNSIILKNTFFLYIRMAIVMFATLYMARVVLRVLGVEDYGIYNVVCGFVFMFNVLNTTLSNGILRFYNYEIGNNNTEKITEIFNTAIRMQLLIALILFILLETFGVWYINNKMVISPDRILSANWVFQFSIISLVLLIIQAPFTSSILSYEKMNFYAGISIIDVFLKLGLIFCLQVISYDKLVLYGALMMGVSFINFFICCTYCLLTFKPIYFNGKSDRTVLKKMLCFSGWLILDPIAYTARGQGSNMVINVFFGTVLNAAYGISNQIATSLDSFVSNISTAFKPQLMQSYSSGDYIRTNSLLYSMSKIMFVLKLMLCVPIVFEIDIVLDLWLGHGYPSYASSFAVLTVIVRLIDSLNLPISNVILATGDIKQYMIITSLIVFSTLPFSYLLFYMGFPPTSLFVTMIILTCINQIISIFIIDKNTYFFSKQDYFKSVILPCCMQCIFVFFIVWIVSLISCYSLLRLFIVSCTSLLVSAIGAYCLVFDITEKQMARSAINRIIKNKK